MVVAENTDTTITKYEEDVNGNDRDESKHELLLCFADCLEDDELERAVQCIKQITSSRKTF